MAQNAAKEDKDFCLDEHLNLKRTHRYYTQVQFQMMVFDVQYCDFVVMTQPSGTPVLVIVRVGWESDFLEKLQRKCSAFLKDYLLPELLTSRLKDKQMSNPTIEQYEQLQRWCICKEPEYGKMIMCSHEGCQIGWFHYRCVDVKRKPRGKWLCPRCKHD